VEGYFATFLFSVFLSTSLEAVLVANPDLFLLLVQPVFSVVRLMAFSF
jgi:hypothetical protein